MKSPLIFILLNYISNCKIRQHLRLIKKYFYCDNPQKHYANFISLAEEITSCAIFRHLAQTIFKNDVACGIIYYVRICCQVIVIFIRLFGSELEINNR